MERKVTREMVRQAVLALLPPVQDLVGRLVAVHVSDGEYEGLSKHRVGYFPSSAERFAAYVVGLARLHLDTDDPYWLPDEVHLELFGRKQHLGKRNSASDSRTHLFFDAELFEPEVLEPRE